MGFKNYVDLFTDKRFLGILLNNFLWVLVVPAMSSAKAILDLQPHGIMVSNGPGDPAAVKSRTSAAR